MTNRTDITRWMTEYDTELFPGFWHFPWGGLTGVNPAVNMGTSYGRHSVSFTDPASTSRREVGGPHLPGPHASASAQAGSMAANPEHGTYGEIRRNKEAGAEIHAEFGDELVIFGFVYRIDRAPNRNIKLVLVDDSNGLTANEMRVVQGVTRSGVATTAGAYEVIRKVRALT